MSATDITATLNRSDDIPGSGWNWAEAATDAWLEAAKAAGLSAELWSTEVDDIDREAAIIEADGILFALEVYGDEIRARSLRDA